MRQFTWFANDQESDAEKAARERLQKNLQTLYWAERRAAEVKKKTLKLKALLHTDGNFWYQARQEYLQKMLRGNWVANYDRNDPQLVRQHGRTNFNRIHTLSNEQGDAAEVFEMMLYNSANYQRDRLERMRHDREAPNAKDAAAVAEARGIY